MFINMVKSTVERPYCTVLPSPSDHRCQTTPTTWTGQRSAPQYHVCVAPFRPLRSGIVPETSTQTFVPFYLEPERLVRWLLLLEQNSKQTYHSLTPLDLNTLQHNRIANVPLLLDSPIVPVSDSPIVPGSRSLPNLPPFILATLLTVTIQQVNNTKSTWLSYARLFIPRPRTNAAPHSVRLLPACPSVHPPRARASLPPVLGSPPIPNAPHCVFPPASVHFIPWIPAVDPSPAHPVPRGSPAFPNLTQREPTGYQAQ